MGQAVKSLLNKAGPIRRVIHRGDQHICGICLSPHDSMEPALQCLVDCFAEFLELDPVVLRRRGLKFNYRCRFCARDYLSYTEAQSCSSNCKTEHEQLFRSELSQLGMLPPPVKRQRRAKAVMVAVSQDVRAWKRHGETNDTAHESDTPPPDAEPINADVPSPPTPPPAPADEMEPVVLGDEDEKTKAPKEKKVKPSEIYTRQGAKYECTVCKERYFTAEEVTKCWESH